MLSLSAVVPILFAFCVPDATAQTDVRIRIAVFPFGYSQGSSQESAQIRDTLCEMLSRTHRYSVMNDAVMMAILRNYGLESLHECTTVPCIVHVGRILGVKGVVQGSVSRSPRGWSLFVRVVSIDDAEVLLERTIEATDATNVFSSHAYEALSAEFRTLEFRKEKKIPWHVVALIVAGTAGVIYLISKAIGFDIFGFSLTEDTGDTDPPED